MGNTDTTQSDWRLCRAAGFLNYAPVGSSGGKLKTVGDGLCRTNTDIYRSSSSYLSVDSRLSEKYSFKSILLDGFKTIISSWDGTQPTNNDFVH